MRRRASSPLARAAAALVVLALLCSTRTAAAGPSFLWKAASEKGVLYLVGSLHVLPADAYPLNPAIDAAFRDSSLLVEEVDLGLLSNPGTQLDMLRRGMLPAGQSLDAVLSPATFARVTKRLDAAGVPVEPLLRFKPWMLSIALSGLEWQKAGFDPSLGLDVHFYDLAKREGRAVQGLETADFQLSRLDDLPADEQDHLLNETLNELDTENASLTDLATAWKAGDAATVERIVLEDMKQEPKLYNRLLVERNRNWLPKIEALLAQPTHAFVVVGAAHLVGPDGLLQMLKAKGYRIEQQ